ncbi:hypothetical protein FRC00_013307 [Tulasnella sp. 408]|nr:hypothetical protein FRC00_013307 [Tulasnella sp. 408]
MGPDFPSASDRSVEDGSSCPSNWIPLVVSLQSLPAEIWNEVILKAQDSDLHIQFTLSQVNHFFRTLVTASPLLWSKLDVMCPLPVASLYLERSANAALDVVADQGVLVDPSPRLVTKNSARAAALYELLRPHRHRVRYLKVTAPKSCSLGPENQNAVPPQEGLTELPDHFLWSSMLSTLEYLELAFGTWEDRNHSQWPLVTRLQELRLYGPWTPSVTVLVSPSLKHLTLGDHPGLGLKVVRDILLSTPALESLTFLDESLNSREGLASDEVVAISSRKSLSVIRCYSLTIKWIVGIIACSNLHDLCVNFLGEVWDPETWSRLFDTIDTTRLQLFSTPLPQIRRLDLVSCEANPSFLEITLEYLPNLKQLRIASASLTDHHLRVLEVKTLINGDVCLCPQLSSLTIENEPLIGSNIVRYVVRSRSKASFPLRSVTLRGVDREKIFWEDLQCIRACGVVDLNVTAFGKDDDDSESSSEWSTDQGSEDELLSGDEDVIAR